MQRRRALKFASTHNEDKLPLDRMRSNSQPAGEYFKYERMLLEKCFTCHMSNNPCCFQMRKQFASSALYILGIKSKSRQVQVKL